MGSSASALASGSLSYQKTVDEIERELLNEKIQAVKAQNKEYFERKARELLERRKEDNLSYPTAKLLVQSCNLNIDQLMSSPFSDEKPISKKFEETKKPTQPFNLHGAQNSHYSPMIKYGYGERNRTMYRHGHKKTLSMRRMGRQRSNTANRGFEDCSNVIQIPIHK